MTFNVWFLVCTEAPLISIRQLSFREYALYGFKVDFSATVSKAFPRSSQLFGSIGHEKDTYIMTDIKL